MTESTYQFLLTVRLGEQKVKMEAKFIKYMELLVNDFMLADQEYAYNRIKDDINELTRID